MAKKEHFDLIKQGVNVWNRWREDNPGESPDLSSVNLCRVNLTEANFSEINLWEANLSKTNLRKANFRGANLCFADLSGANLRHADLSGADLTNADLSSADLSSADLRGAKLWGTNISRTVLNEADFSRADMNEADLSYAEISGVRFWGVNFTQAKFLKANIIRTDFSCADLIRADFTESAMERVTFANVDLSVCKGLETARHSGPSAIGIDTTYRSAGNIPEAFLRGAGIPDNFISYMKLLAGYPAPFYSCFILYIADDTGFAEQLYGDMLEKGIRCWLSECGRRQADSDIFPGTECRIAPLRCEPVALLPVLSKKSISDKAMEREIQAAFEAECSGRKAPIFLICTDRNVTGSNPAFSDSARFRCIADFSEQTNPDAYTAALNRVIDEIYSVFPKPPSRAAAVHEPKPSAPKVQSEGIGNIHFPDAVYKIIGENNCPFYILGDSLKVSGKSALFPRDKEVCLILLQDIADVHSKYQSTGRTGGYAFKCSGCTGSVRLKYQENVGAATINMIRDKDAVANLLAGFSFFQTINPEGIRYVASFLKSRTFEANDFIIKKGESGKNLYIVVSGKIEVVGEGGISIALMGKGEVFGEMSLLSGNPVGASIKAMESTTVFYLSGNDFKKVLIKVPSLQMYFTRLLARRLVEIHDVRTKEFASGMVGKISEMPPSELFQTLNINQKTGMLSLQLSKGPAILCFREGRLIRSEYDKKEGREAFYEMLKEKEGRFKFTPGLPREEMEANEIGDFMWLLMEGTRKMDEKDVCLELPDMEV
ncbi:MAG: hypothetical protein BWK80_38195 [Desulfobacteraceae bacterium IS3]|nr:MAG: hypothetical protein BWK80_38195 [Desulfobacteraceae bacterium IS3]